MRLSIHGQGKPIRADPGQPKSTHHPPTGFFVGGVDPSTSRLNFVTERFTKHIAPKDRRLEQGAAGCPRGQQPAKARTRKGRVRIFILSGRAQWVRQVRGMGLPEVVRPAQITVTPAPSKHTCTLSLNLGDGQSNGTCYRPAVGRDGHKEDFGSLVLNQRLAKLG